jgi:hypothetical protein
MHKRNEGRVCGKSLSTALALLFFVAIAAPASAGELYGLVVGIDDYVGNANDLDGAANDADDIAQSLARAERASRRGRWTEREFPARALYPDRTRYARAHSRR